MRRILPKYVRDPFLRELVYGVGSASQARNELRWIKQEVRAEEVPRAVSLRAKGFPLQYILKSQPFGHLDITCKPGVLIPRWETEEWVSELARFINDNMSDGKPLRVLDIGTGSGCILFLLCSLVPNSFGMGLDVSPKAMRLFQENRARLNMKTKTDVSLHNLHLPLTECAAISTDEGDLTRDFDLVVSNPPYITRLADADYQVRTFEPELALIEQPEIYENLVKRAFETSARMAVFEVGNKQQIDLCIRLFNEQSWNAWGQRDSAGNWRTIWAKRPEPNDHKERVN